MKKTRVTKDDSQNGVLRVSIDELVPLFEERLAAGQTVEFSPMGTSMLPMLRQGRDTVILSPPPEKLKKYDIPLYRRKNGKYILHRIVGADECYTCMGDNQTEREQGIEKDQILAVVSAFKRGGRLHSVNEPLYRAYCVLWVASRPVRRIWRGLRRRAAEIIQKTKNR